MPDNRILIDTSIWVDYFRGREIRLADAVDRLLESDRVVTLEIIEAELLRGAKTEKEIDFLKNHFSAIPILEMPSDSWREVGLFSYRLARKGYLPALVDTFIALASINSDIPLFTRDRDFRRIAGFSSLILFEP